MKDIQDIIDTCILLTQNRKDILKRNFPLFPISKQERIYSILTKVSNVSFSSDELSNFGYGMELWKSKKALQRLESQDI